MPALGTQFKHPCAIDRPGTHRGRYLLEPGYLRKNPVIDVEVSIRGLVAGTAALFPRPVVQKLFTQGAFGLFLLLSLTLSRGIGRSPAHLHCRDLLRL